MADYEDITVSNLIINNISQEKFDELKAAGQLQPDQIYLTPTEESGGATGDYLPLSGGTLTGPLTLPGLLPSNNNTKLGDTNNFFNGLYLRGAIFSQTEAQGIKLLQSFYLPSVSGTLARVEDIPSTDSFATKTELQTKQDKLSYTPEDQADKANDIDSLNDKTAQYPTVNLLEVYISEQANEFNIALLDKADASRVATLEGYDYVVSSQVPSADNGYTWYRLYKSGWLESGGTLSGKTSVTFPKAYQTIPAVVISTAETNTAVVASTVINNVTTTGFAGHKTQGKSDWDSGKQNMAGYWMAAGVSVNTPDAPDVPSQQ